jgi:hypothetical protein
LAARPGGESGGYVDGLGQLPRQGPCPNPGNYHINRSRIIGQAHQQDEGDGTDHAAQKTDATSAR